jgi:hypothetical protein
MVDQTMINTYTTLETFKTTDGNTIIYNTNCVGKFLNETIEENYKILSEEERTESFYVGHMYGDLLEKLLSVPMGEVRRNPKEEYEHFISIPKDDNISDYMHNSKIERLRQNKEWFESQNN